MDWSHHEAILFLFGCASCTTAEADERSAPATSVSGAGGSTSSQGGAGQGGATTTSTGQGGTAQGGGGAGQGGDGGGGAPAVVACDTPLRCIDVTQYFCDEISGPDDGSFEEACTQEGGTFGAGSCVDGDFLWVDACLFDCDTPNQFSNIGGLGEQACTDAGGTYVMRQP